MKRIVLLLWLMAALSAELRSAAPLQVMFYNAENLFDWVDDPTHDDNEFTPDGLRHWNRKRYWEKLNRLAKVIVAAGREQIPALIGLAEVENDSVLYHLTRGTPLRTLGYEFITGTSDDRRGIRTALLYQPDRVKPVSITNRPIDLSFDPDARPTRHLLIVSLHTSEGDTLHAVVCHFPSRSAGIPQTNPLRMAAARTLRSAIDSLQTQHHGAMIVTMGDFNDNPGDRSLQDGLHALPADTLRPDIRSLYLLAPFCSNRQVEGSYKFRGNWYTFDQILVTGSLLHPDSRLRAFPAQMTIVAPPFLLMPETAHFGLRPFATYYGMKYQGGFSDHLPVILTLNANHTGSLR